MPGKIKVIDALYTYDDATDCMQIFCFNMGKEGEIGMITLMIKKR